MRLADAPGWLNSRLNTVAGSPAVTYRRGNDSITELAAVPVETRHTEIGDEPASFTARDRDWIVWVEDLVNAGERWTPKRGDEIDWTDATGTLRTFRVLPRTGDRCFRHTDQTMQQYRIYTQEGTPNSE